MASVTETTWVSARISVDLLDRLRAVADADDRPVSYEVRQALKNHVEALEATRLGGQAS